MLNNTLIIFLLGLLVTATAAYGMAPGSLTADAAALETAPPADEDENAAAEDEEGEDEAEDQAPKIDAGLLSGLRFRLLGPALMAGRISDIAVHPDNDAHFYIAAASGGVWKTTNGGITFSPIFDDAGSYSIGCLTLDPNNPNVLWVGTGENNSQRSVSWGDGVYVTRDGGKNWDHLGLEDSEHIGMIAVDPRDSNVVYVAAQGPLWRAGPQRGLYKTTNGGESWRCILDISPDTGVNEVHLDPRDPDIVYASAYQRRRHVWTLINGGPESALYKSTNGGRSWRKLTRGLPGVDLGRIGLDISPADPDYLYAIVEAAEGEGGVFRSTDRGETWEKRSGYVSSSPQYYNELVCDPQNRDTVYSLDTFSRVSRDGGRSWERLTLGNRHVDDHALWINPRDPTHFRIGGDGGLYETYDNGENWRFFANLPITQFYRITADTSEPFYYVYGGTQDNSSQGGPSRTTDRIGVANEHWFITVGGDGYKTQVDPEDPNIVYSQWQYGGLVRHDRRSGEVIDIKPREKPGDEPYRWNWDTPLIISPHSHTRLYAAANRVFRSEDRGDSWTAISPDLSRQLNRDELAVMGRLQLADAVAKSDSTSFYGNIVSLEESPVVEGLIYVGTDDGIIQVTEDGGESWRKIEEFPDVPKLSYVSDVYPSRHEADVVYACFDNHKMGDFKSYLLKSEDRGQTWISLAGDLPDRHVCLSFEQDTEQSDILFVGTEFGVFVTLDGGEKWIKMKGGVPTISIRDMDVQERETDLVLGTFGRGIYILDDYTPLRELSPELLAEDAHIFPIKDALRYIERSRLSGRNGQGTQGASFYAADNPPFGAMFTYYLKEKIKTLKELRKEAEKEALKKDETPEYPPVDRLRDEAEQRTPLVLLIVQDADGNVIRRIEAARDKGIHRAAWDLRYPASTPIQLYGEGDRPPWWSPPSGPLALPGEYTVTLVKEIDGEVEPLTDPRSFRVIPLELATFAAKDKEAVLAFRQKVARLQRAVSGALRAADEAQNRINHVRQAVLETPDASPALLAEVESLQQRLYDLLVELRGNPTKAQRNVPETPSINERVGAIVGAQWNATSPPTQTHVDGYRYAGEQFQQVLAALRALMEEDLTALERELEKAGAPWTPGRLPEWELED